MAFAPNMLRNYNETTKLAQFNYFKVNYGYLINHKLPPPFAMRCVYYMSQLDYYDQSYCKMKCLLALTMKRFNKVPFSTIISEKVNYTHISLMDIVNNSTELDKFELTCRQRCSFDDCFEMLSLTKVSVEPDSRGLQFAVLIPQEPFVTVVYLPKIEFSELIVYVLSCVGTWFGISILSLNPVKLIVNCKNKAKTGNYVDKTIIDIIDERVAIRCDLYRKQWNSEMKLKTENFHKQNLVNSKS